MTSQVTMFANDSLVVNITVLNADGSNPNLADATGTWWLARSGSPGAQVFVRKTGGDVTFSNASGSWVMSFAIAPSDTANLSGGHYYHEAQVVTGDGSMYTVLADTFTLQPSIIRP